MAIDNERVVAMLAHWLATPVHGFFGSDYGADLASLLLKPLSQSGADQLLAKLKRDIPILASLDSDTLSVTGTQEGFETMRYFLKLGSIYIPLERPALTGSGETFRVDAQ